MSAFADQSLPPPLATAIEEFDLWMRSKHRADEALSAPLSPLYHYTDEWALRGILEKRELWCFTHNSQKDQTEFRYSLDIGRSVIRQEADRASPFVRLMLCGLHGMLAEKLEERFGFYFFSFSSHRDHSRQWTDYGDAGSGFAIGFSPALFQIDQYEPSPHARENRFVGEDVYGRNAARARHRLGVRKLADIAERVERDHPLVAQDNHQAWFDRMNLEFLATMFLWNCLTAKACKFCCEQETRYIIMGIRSAFDGCRKRHRGRDYVETPSLSLSEPGKIAEILVGPRAPAGAEEMVRDLLASNGYPSGISVSRSKAALGQ